MKKDKKIKKGKTKTAKTELFNNKILFLIGIIILTILVLIIILLFFNFNNEITCTKTIGDKNILVQDKKVVTTLKGKKIEKVNLIKTLKFNKHYVTYIDIVKEALEKEYKELNLDNSIIKKDNNLIVNVKYNESKKYLLDNIEVSIDEGSVNISVISEDYNNEFESIDLSKESNINTMKDYFKQKGYVCK